MKAAAYRPRTAPDASVRISIRHSLRHRGLRRCHLRGHLRHPCVHFTLTGHCCRPPNLGARLRHLLVGTRLDLLQPRSDIVDNLDVVHIDRQNLIGRPAVETALENVSRDNFRLL